MQDHRPRAEFLTLWRGRQWMVTSAGLQTSNAPEHLVIAKRALGEIDQRTGGFAVVADAVGRNWLDASDFREAWLQVRAFHRDVFEQIPEVWLSAIQRRSDREIEDLVNRRRAA